MEIIGTMTPEMALGVKMAFALVNGWLFTANISLDDMNEKYMVVDGSQYCEKINDFWGARYDWWNDGWRALYAKPTTNMNLIILNGTTHPPNWALATIHEVCHNWFNSDECVECSFEEQMIFYQNNLVQSIGGH